MKYLSIICVIALFSCKKQQCKAPQSTQSDITLSGCWTPTTFYKNMNLCFHKDSMLIYGAKYRFFLLNDTIYKFYDFKVVEPVFQFRTTKHTDKIILTPVYGMNPSDTFSRQN